MPPPLAPSECELLKRVADGDLPAFSAFYDRAAVLMFSVAHRMLGQSADAGDVVQEAFLAIWEKAGSFNPALSSALSWAVILVRNKAIDRLRSQQRRSRYLEPGHDPEALAVLFHPSQERDDLAAMRGAVQKALRILGPAERQAVELAFFGGLTQREIAAHLDEPLGTVKARIRRGLQRLRQPLLQVRLEIR